MDNDTIALIKKYNTLIQNKLPPKINDSRSFSISCTISDLNFTNALCYLGASVLLIPFSIAQKLGLKEVKAVNIILQLADRSIKYPIGILENVLIKVKQVIIPLDFVVLHMEEDAKMPIILGKPFLAITGSIIDVQEGKMMF